MADNLTTTQLHERLQRAISRQVERGASPAAAAEAAFTVATANLAGVHGPRKAAASLAFTAVALEKLADRADVDQRAPRH